MIDISSFSVANRTCGAGRFADQKQFIIICNIIALATRILVCAVLDQQTMDGAYFIPFGVAMALSIACSAVIAGVRRGTGAAHRYVRCSTAAAHRYVRCST